MHRISKRCGSLALLALLLPSLAPGTAQAEPNYSHRVLIKLGDKAGPVTLPAQSSTRIFLGPVTDTGRVTFGVGNSLQDVFYMGGFNGTTPGLLMQYLDDTFTPIAPAGTPGPVGDWPQDVSFLWPFGVNQSGNVLFTAARGRGRNLLGTFLWDARTRRSTPVALRGMPAVYNTTFTDAGSFGSAINDRNDIALVASIRGTGVSSGPGLFFRGWDGSLLPILLPGQALPGGSKVQSSAFPMPSINNDGTVAFLVRRTGERQNSACIWEQGTIRPIVTVGTEVKRATIRALQDTSKITAVSSVYVNNANRKVLLTAAVDGSSRHGVYQWSEGNLLPVAVPGQAMPGGGTFRTVQNMLSPAYLGDYGSSATICLGVSPASASGEHVLLATLDDNSTAAYRIDADGKLSLILKSGAGTYLGSITKVGFDSPASINSKGEIALAVRINNLAAVMLMRPTTQER
jgi:hypothetical protein